MAYDVRGLALLQRGGAVRDSGSLGSANFLGISSLEASACFKQQHWPGLDSREYGISQGCDSATASVVDGEILAAAAQERYGRKKHTGGFPLEAMQFCPREAWITLEDVDEIAHVFDDSPFRPMYSLDPDASNLDREVFSKEAPVRQVHRRFPGFLAAKIQPALFQKDHADAGCNRRGDCWHPPQPKPGMGEALADGELEIHDVPLAATSQCLRSAMSILWLKSSKPFGRHLT
jgi:Carbamoyltransferase N-terminus